MSRARAEPLTNESSELASYEFFVQAYLCQPHGADPMARGLAMTTEGAVTLEQEIPLYSIPTSTRAVVPLTRYEKLDTPLLVVSMKS